MNDHFGSILHEDRMAEFRRDGDASRRAAEAAGKGLKRPWTRLGFPVLAAVLVALAVTSALLIPA